jgi:hypothetical protein
MAAFEEMVKTSLVAENNKKLQEAIQEAQNGEMEPVDSEAIEEMGYNPSLKIATVTFTDGSGYEYFGVSPEIYQAWSEASSIGQYFNFVIRSGFYPYVRI